MARRHERRTKKDGAVLSQNPIGKQAAKKRRQINETGIEAVDMRRKRLHPQRPEHGFEEMPERSDPDDVLDLSLMQQVFHHVEDEERPHSVIGEALPHFRREQKGQCTGVAKQVARVRTNGASRCCGHDGCGGGGADLERVAVLAAVVLSGQFEGSATVLAG